MATINAVDFSAVTRDALNAARAVLADGSVWASLKDIVQNIADGLIADVKFLAKKKLSGEFDEGDAKIYLEDHRLVARARIRSIAIISLQAAEKILNAVLDVFRVAIRQAIGWTVV